MAVNGAVEDRIAQWKQDLAGRKARAAQNAEERFAQLAQMPAEPVISQNPSREKLNALIAMLRQNPPASEVATQDTIAPAHGLPHLPPGKQPYIS